MIDLLKNAKGEIEDIIEEEKDRDKEKSLAEKKETDKESEAEARVDKKEKFYAEKPKISQYKDPEGLTVGKLELGLWFLKHRKKFLYFLYFFLIIISLVTWPLFLYTYGKYVIIGMKQDQKLVYDLILNENINREAILRQAPLPMAVKTIDFLANDDGFYDFYSAISNPNNNHYAEFNYRFKSGATNFPINKGFILPSETKYILSLGHEINFRPQELEIEFLDINWTRITSKNFPNWANYEAERINFTISDKKYTPAQSTILSEKININSLEFTVRNNTVFNYLYADFILMLFNRENILGINKYKINKLMSEETRDVVFSWTGRHGNVTNIEIIPDIDILDDSLYLKYKGEAAEIK